MLKSSEVESTLDELTEWFKLHPKLPEEVDRLLLRRFFKCMSGDVEETKKLILLNYELRNRNPHIFIDRDPEGEKFQISRIATDLVALPGLTPERNKLLCYRLADMDPSKLNSVEESKIFFALADCRFTMLDAEQTVEQETEDDNMATGDVQIVDIGGYTMSHIARISLMVLRVYMKFLQEAYPVRLKAMHVINCPSYVDKMVAIMKPFINAEVYKMIHFHMDGLESLYEQVPRDMLPEEYGGKAGKMSDLKEEWSRILSEKRQYLLDPKQWKVEQTATKSFWSIF